MKEANKKTADLVDEITESVLSSPEKKKSN